MAAQKALTFVNDPETARLRFHFKPLTNCLLATGIFIVWTFLFAAFPFRAIVDLVGMGILFFLVFHVWDKRAITISCPHCGGMIRTNTPWVCGFKQCINLATDAFPFVHQCQHCHAAPKAYKCHHRDCGQLIFLTKDKQGLNFAYCLNAEDPEPRDGKPPLIEHTHEDIMRAKKNEIAIAELDEKLKAIKSRTESPKIKTILERKIEAFDQSYDGVLGLRAHAKKRRAEAQEMYKDDPVALKEANDTIDAILRDST